MTRSTATLHSACTRQTL